MGNTQGAELGCGEDVCCGCERSEEYRAMRRMVPAAPAAFATSDRLDAADRLAALGLAFMDEPAPDSRFGYLCALTREETNALAHELHQDPSLLGERDSSSNNALHYCVKHRRLDAAAVLCSHGADPDAANSSGHTPHFLAAAIPDATFVRKLLELRNKHKSKRRQKRTASRPSSTNTAARPSSTDSTGFQNVQPGIDVKFWNIKLKAVEKERRATFDQDTNNRYNVVASTEERIRAFDGQEVRMQQLKSWAVDQRRFLDAQREKKLNSDYGMLVKKHPNGGKEEAFSLRPAPWGGYCRMEEQDEDDQKAGVLLVTRQGDVAVHKMGLVANAKTVPKDRPNKVLRDFFAQNGKSRSRDERYVVPYEQRVVAGWKSTGLPLGVQIPGNEGTDAQAPRRFASSVMNNGL